MVGGASRSGSGVPGTVKYGKIIAGYHAVQSLLPKLTTQREGKLCVSARSGGAALQQRLRVDRATYRIV